MTVSINHTEDISLFLYYEESNLSDILLFGNRLIKSIKILLI